MMRSARFAAACVLALAASAGLTGCARLGNADSPEVVDQAGHAALGAVMGRDLGRYTSAERARDALEAYVTAREALQNGEPNPYCSMVGLERPTHWGPGKRRDLEWWLRGIDHGIARAQRDQQ